MVMIGICASDKSEHQEHHLGGVLIWDEYWSEVRCFFTELVRAVQVKVRSWLDGNQKARHTVLTNIAWKRMEQIQCHWLRSWVFGSRRDWHRPGHKKHNSVNSVTLAATCLVKIEYWDEPSLIFLSSRMTQKQTIERDGNHLRVHTYPLLPLTSLSNKTWTKHVKRIQETATANLAATDTWGLSGQTEFGSTCELEGLKDIYYVLDSASEKLASKNPETLHRLLQWSNARWRGCSSTMTLHDGLNKQHYPKIWKNIGLPCHLNDLIMCCDRSWLVSDFRTITNCQCTNLERIIAQLVVQISVLCRSLAFRKHF